jgi:hypothetical protein
MSDARPSVAWEENLDAQALWLEGIACGVRQQDGFVWPNVKDHRIVELCAQDLLMVKGDRVCPTDRGMEIADHLASTLSC